MTIRVALEQDTVTGDWAAWCPELPGCASADTTREAVAGIREAIALYLSPREIDLGEGVELIEVVA